MNTDTEMMSDGQDPVIGYDQRDWCWESLGKHFVKGDLQQLGGEIHCELDDLSQSLDDVDEEQVKRIKKHLNRIQSLIDKIENVRDH